MHMLARAHALRVSALTYPGSIEHVSTVRADLRALLPDCPAADDVILCASELAANAALHSRSRLPAAPSLSEPRFTPIAVPASK
jgi:hypothetical protein